MSLLDKAFLFLLGFTVVLWIALVELRLKMYRELFLYFADKSDDRILKNILERKEAGR